MTSIALPTRLTTAIDIWVIKELIPKDKGSLKAMKSGIKDFNVKRNVLERKK